MDILSQDVDALHLEDAKRPYPRSLTPASTYEHVSRLTSLPPELLCSVISSVDPISLITLAQTSHALRSCIKPSRHHILERLLRIELEQEHAAQGSTSTDSPELAWLTKSGVGRTPYACSGCLKLLPHIMFDNHSIFKLKWRKPPVGSHEATKLTDWIYPDDTDERGTKLQIHRQRNKEKKDIEVWQQRYKEAIEAGDEDLRQVAELHLAGRSRTTRLCNDCKVQRGYFTRSNYSNRSRNSDLIILISRQLPFRTSIDRCFPTLFPELNRSDYPRIFKVMREGTEELISLHTSKCSTCEQWKEVAQFLQIHDQISFDGMTEIPSHMEQAMCNRCLANERPRTFIRRSKQIALQSAKNDLDKAQYAFHFGWRLLEMYLRPDNTSKRTYWNHLGRLKTQLLANLPWKASKEYGGDQKILLVDRCDLDDLRNRVRLFRGFCNWLSAADRREVLSNEWFKYWVEDYEKLEKAWEVARARVEWIDDEGFGETVLEWAKRS